MAPEGLNRGLEARSRMLRAGRRVPRVAGMVTLEENEGRFINYKTQGTCSTEINFELRNGKVHSVSFKDGCDGNLKALSILAEGMNAEELVRKLKGLRCGRKKTSCGDQLAAAVAQALVQAK